MKNMSKGEILVLVVVMSLLFSYSLGLVMLFFHEIILGAREITPIAFGWHWLRDSSIAFPIAIIVSLVAVPISQTIAKRVTGATGNNRLEIPTIIICMSLMLSAVMTYALLIYHHNILGVEEANELPFALHWLRDAAIGFAIAIPIATVAFPLSQKIVRRIMRRSA